MHSVSVLYLDELAGRREQVVADNLREKVNVIYTALDLMTEEDLSDSAHLQAYQANIKRLFRLERFAFVGTDNLIYTSNGVRAEIGTPCLGALLDSGLSLKFEVEGKQYDLDPGKKDADPRSRYVVILYHGELPVADLTYANPSDRACPVRDCEVDVLDFHTDRPGWDSVEILVNGIPVNRIRMEEIPEKFPGFEKTFSETPEYVFTALTETQSMVAYFRGTRGGDLAGFGIRNYLPGSAGTER